MTALGYEWTPFGWWTKPCPECSEDLDILRGRDNQPYAVCLDCGTAYDVEPDGDMDDTGVMRDNTSLYLRYCP